MNDDKRHQLFFGISAGVAVLAALLVSGWFGEPIGLPAGLIIAAAGGLVVGWLTGENAINKVFQTLAGVIFSFGVVIGTVWYLKGRSSVWNLELLLPMALGGLPGVVAYFLFRRLEQKPSTRAATACVFLAGMAVAMIQAVPSTEQDLERQEEAMAQNQDAIAFHPDARGVLRAQFGPAADEFLLQVDKVNSMVDMYSVERIAAEAGSSIDKLEASLLALTEHAAKQKGEDQLRTDAEFRSYREVVEATRTFLKDARAIKKAEEGRPSPD